MTLASLLPVALASPLLPSEDKPVYWLLAGDLKTAPKGGWGDGFLATTVATRSSGHNYGHSGAITASFRAGSNWGKATKHMQTYKDRYRVYVTIQFVHNDQKDTSGVSLDQYKAKLKSFADEAKTAVAEPVLLTPVTRRELFREQSRYVNAIGKAAASKYNLVENDWMHLDEWGGVFFARIVTDLLVEKYRELQQFTTDNSTLSALIKQGKPA
ncbi:SGNH hydrolase [Westerdykella ornata]|uniref:SGNH hydrolase n=1 Tax=Westerdykella ornata TaxID=318751 RepID=A0A6A6K022_WESOR|nr:SGNH hydrolase [Westerdykella ornata]KAF2281386.1 SGNH hydrolase [Westerdykella ornata]